jgi:hypothetical protein
MIRLEADLTRNIEAYSSITSKFNDRVWVTKCGICEFCNIWTIEWPFSLTLNYNMVFRTRQGLLHKNFGFSSWTPLFQFKTWNLLRVGNERSLLTTRLQTYDGRLIIPSRHYTNRSRLDNGRLKVASMDGLWRMPVVNGIMVHLMHVIKPVLHLMTKHWRFSLRGQYKSPDMIAMVNLMMTITDPGRYTTFNHFTTRTSHRADLIKYLIALPWRSHFYTSGNLSAILVASTH